MPNFGAQLEDARLNFYNPDRELISKNIKDTEAVPLAAGSLLGGECFARLFERKGPGWKDLE